MKPIRLPASRRAPARALPDVSYPLVVTPAPRRACTSDTWVTARNEAIRVADLEEDHLEAILTMLYRKICMVPLSRAQERAFIQGDLVEDPGYIGPDEDSGPVDAEYRAWIASHSTPLSVWSELIPTLRALIDEGEKRGLVFDLFKDIPPEPGPHGDPPAVADADEAFDPENDDELAMLASGHDGYGKIR